MKNPGGRPTKLTQALVDKAEQFVIDRRNDRTLLPTVEGLALELNISRDTVYAWSEGEPTEPLAKRFSDIVSNLKSAQAEKLVQYGLTGKYNPTIAKLILSGKHGYVEKQATDVTTNGKELPTPILRLDVQPNNSDDQDSST